MTTELFDRVHRPSAAGHADVCDPPREGTGRHMASATGGAPEWERWGDRWHATSTLTPRTRSGVRSNLLKVGRWLQAGASDAADPADWTRQTCAAWVAALDRMNVGDYVQRTVGLKDRVRKPLAASSKEGQLAALRRFLTDCQEWEWLPRRFDPQRALATPRSIAALLGRSGPARVAGPGTAVAPPKRNGVRADQIGRLCCSMYWCMTERGAPPTDPAK
ncbi:hypothetical protein [Nonomuraea turcica]|uniref:hypothetical protein n=1 Tax=Nonomuraea sp. G32 TaxID=3067274 RepID=UPI00273C5B5C|nr:hypothetical protein [Nonomuraea sp. G32]MDP4511219.1 hypothetical protein [Nonomuraea sp. G32]